MDEHSSFQGTLEEIRIPEILHTLSRQKETGSLHIQGPHHEKTIYLEEGKIVFSASTDPDDRLGPLLLRRNKVTYRQLEQCAPKVEPGKRLGTVLVLEGIIQPNELYHGVIDQIKEIIYSVFDWETGKFHFQAGPLPQNEVITLNLSTPDLILTGMQRIWRWSWIRTALPGLDTVYRKCEGWTPVVRKMNLTPDMEAVLDLFDRPRTLEEVLQISSIGEFETCRFVWSFLILGVIEEILVAPVWTAESVEAGQAMNDTTALPISIESLPFAIPAPEITSDQGETLKIEMPEQAADNTAIVTDEPVVESLLVDPLPFEEVSFADLAELTNAEQSGEPEPIQPESEPWESHVQTDLKKFNELHRYLFEMISLEIGNGTSTFLSKAFKKASIRYPLVFEGVTMNDFGELSEPVLLANIQGNLVEDYQQALDFLIAEERSMISLFLEMKRVDAIEAGIKRLLEQRNRALA